MSGRVATSSSKHAEHTPDKAPATSAGKYLYAVVENLPDLRYPAVGIGGADIYTISDGQLSAVVSDIFGARVRAERAHLAAHRNVLAQLMAETTPLPISFGTIARGGPAVRKALSGNHQALLKQLRRVSGKVEMGIRVCWDTENIFEYLVSIHPELRTARDSLFGGQHEPTQTEKLELGRLFERIMEEDREGCAQSVEETIGPYCAAIKRNPCRHEREVMNLACLLPREEQSGFEEHVFTAASRFDSHYAFDYNGPWPPYNFVDLKLEL